MSWRSSERRYGWAARLLHWTTAVLTIALFVSGFVMRRVLASPTTQVAAPDDPQSQLYTLHVVVGFAVTAVIVGRLLVLWRDTHPPDPRLSKVRAQLFRWVHRLQYLAVVALVGSGSIMLLQAYRAVIDSYLWPQREGQFISTLAVWDFKVIRGGFPGVTHRPLGWIFVALLVAHLTGVLTHQAKTGEPFRRMLWRLQ